MKIGNMSDLISYVRKLPYQTRVKILWGTFGILAIILFTLWVLSLKSTLKNLNTSDLVKINPETNTEIAGQTKTPFATVERAEFAADSLQLYFNFQNPTTDILNISKLSDIQLHVGGKQINPKQITDRQGQPFVQKILSGAQNFGILIFDKTASDSDELIFDQMFLEQSPSQMFSQKIQLDFKQLEKNAKLRD